MTGHKELLRIASDIATRAGERAAVLRQAGAEVAASKSSETDVVTAADRETERLIRELLAEARPDDGFLGEESGDATGSTGLAWVVDPIDGTVNYLYGIPHWAVSIAVVEGDPDPATWTALAGVVLNAPADELFTAVRGGGAALNGTGIHVAEAVPLAQALIGTGFGYVAERREQQTDVLRGIIGSVRDIRRMGTASLDLCAVASGRLNAYYEWGLNAWDFAAAALIASEAGATVAGEAGGPPSSDLVIAGHPEVADALARLLRKPWM